MTITYSLLALLLALVMWFAYHLRKDTVATPLDLITSPVSGRLSAAKIGQLVGIIVATWVIITLTSKGALSFDLFTTYLLYIGGVDAYSKWLRSKPTGTSSTKVTKSTVTTEAQPADPE